MAEFSDEAKELMCGLFHFGRGTVTSGPPHAFRTKHQSAFDELETAKLIRKEPFNEYDKWTYTPEPEMATEAERHKKWYFGRALASLTPSPR